MSSPKGAGEAILIGMLLLLPGAGVEGLSVLEQSQADFAQGEAVNATADSSGVALDYEKADDGIWTKLSDGRPASRTGAGFVPIGNGRTLLFGGGTGGGHSYFCDTWIYVSALNRWKEVSPDNRVPGRGFHSMAYSPRHGMAVVFGGNVVKGPGFVQPNDTWVFSVAANAWSERSPAESPSTRLQQAMAYDPLADRVVLFGGMSYMHDTPGYYLYNDTWTYDIANDTWKNVTFGQAPPGACDGAMCFDEDSGRMVLFGGLPDWKNETWMYNTGTNEWMEVRCALSPPPLKGHSMVYDRARKECILFGGYSWYGSDDLRTLGETWAFSASTGQWSNLTQAFAPAPRYHAAFAYDESLGGALLFAGNPEIGLAPGDLWTFNSSDGLWREVSQSYVPFETWMAPMVFDESTGREVLFGGSKYEASTFTFDLENKTWTNRTPEYSPAPRYYHAMAYDPVHGQTVLFGGRDRAGNCPTDTWLYDDRTNRWSQPSGMLHPPGRSEFAMAADGRSGAAVLFGGHDGNFKDLGDTWEYDPVYNLWTRMDPPVSPPARAGQAMAYDAGTGEFILFGGSGQNGTLNDTWSYNLSRDLWVNRTPAFSPPAREYHGMAYDASSGLVVVFGGAGRPFRLMNDTWAYDSESNRWTRLLPAAPLEARYALSMAYDRPHDAFVVFGGYSDRYISDTWVFRFNLSILGSGLFTSRPVDLGGRAYFGSFEWEASVPAGASVRLQLRSADTAGNLSGNAFTGPDGTAATSYDRSGLNLSSALNGSRWLQYRARLEGARPTASPVLKAVRFRYNLLHSIEVTSPREGDSWTGGQRICWRSSDPDNDTLTVDVFLENASASVALIRGLPAKNGGMTWDTAAFVNGTYRIRVTARDGLPSIPLSVIASSGEFSIRHPAPPNLPPHVELVSPPDGATADGPSVRLEWNGSDPEGDRLAYRVMCAQNPLVERTVPLVDTFATFAVLGNLTAGATYFWTVDASDGRWEHTDFPAGVRSFTIRTLPVNHPPVVSGFPPGLAVAGELFSYLAQASDADGDALSFELAQGPAGMTVDGSTGRLLWTPGEADVGYHSVKVNVSDGRGGTAYWNFTLEVRAVAVPPSCAITAPRNGATVSGRILILGTARNGSSPLSRVELRLDGGAWGEASGLGNWSSSLDTAALSDGRHRIEARSSDGLHNSSIASVVFFVENPPPASGGGMPAFAASLAAIAAIIIGGVLVLRRRRIRATAGEAGRKPGDMKRGRTGEPGGRPAGGPGRQPDRHR